MIKSEKEALLHWNYFASLETDVAQVARYVELDRNNFTTHSIELVRIYLAACSEVDVVAGQLCKSVDPASDAGRINEYRLTLRGRFPDIEESEITMPRYGLILRPWSKWKREGTPDWWSDYQLVKHHRADNYRRGNLHNVLNAVAGLLTLTIVFYRHASRERLLRPVPVLFLPAKQLAYVSPITGADMALVLNDRAR